jgi:DNA repair exonuclease SbcCD ATPase subunit
MKTDMRIRFKTKFFKRLSELGDHIFPKRKALIEQVSQEFERDIERFVANHFQNGQVVGAPYYALREEIKALQGMAKVFTLSSSVFNRTRMKLSECWDQIKVLEKEHKKEVHAKRAASSENRQVIVQKIEELKGRSEGISLQDLDKEIDEISREMRQTDLQREDVRELQSALHGLRAPHMAAREAKAKAMEEAEKEKLRQKRERVVQTKEKIAQLLKEGQQMEADVLEQSFKDLQAEIKQLDAAKTDLQQMDRSLRQLKDLVADRKERSLLNLSEDDRQVLENLKTVLKQKKVRRQEIKDQLEQHRRSLGSSNLDFERAMLVQELVEQEKERLEKANAGIEEIEQKIAELEG